MRLVLAFLALAFPFSSAFAAETFNWSNAIAAELETAIAKGDYQRVTSVMIMADGEVAYEGYFNGADAQTLHNTRSVTKTVNSILLGAAIADGAIASVDEPIVKFFRDKRPLRQSG